MAWNFLTLMARRFAPFHPAVRLREDDSPRSFGVGPAFENSTRSRRFCPGCGHGCDGIGAAREDRRYGTAELRDWFHASTRRSVRPLDNWTRVQPAFSRSNGLIRADPSEAGFFRIVRSTASCAGVRLDLKRVHRPRGSAVDFLPRLSELLKSLALPIIARPRHPAQDETTSRAFQKTSLSADGSSRRPAGDDAVPNLVLRRGPEAARRTALVRQGPDSDPAHGTPPTSAMTNTPSCSTRSARPAASGRPFAAALRRRCHDALHLDENLAQRPPRAPMRAALDAPDGTHQQARRARQLTPIFLPSAPLS